MAHITRIKAKENDSNSTEKPDEKAKNPPVKVPKEQLKKVESDKKSDKKTGNKSDKKSDKKPFILIRPIVYFFRYLRDSWREIRQVRWPSRKATWKLFFAIIIYTLLFGAIIMLLDVLFTWVFNTII